jgi:hypothetical protein
MGFFTTKKQVRLENFCRDFYDNSILVQTIHGIDVSGVLAEQFKKSIVEVCPEFIEVDIEKIKNEIIVLRFELFAFAFIHPMYRDRLAVAQSIFTKQYLHEKNRDDIWEKMKNYNDAIDKAMPIGLSKSNLIFWTGVKKDLTEKLLKNAKENGLVIDDSASRATNRLCSENSWRDKTFADGFVVAFWASIFKGTEGTYFLHNTEAQIRLIYYVRMYYKLK